jgi:hypothetical protein
VREYGFYEGIGHATSRHGAETTFRQACGSLAHAEFEVQRKMIRLDGRMVEAFVAERA